MDGDLAPARHTISRFPVEVCENIIDLLYSVDVKDQVEHSRALHHCALVCRAWRVRSQRNLFYSVVLHDLAALHRFAAVLDNGPHLRDYVHEVTLIGRTLHTTASPLSVFPVVLHGKLPRLEELTINHVREDESWYPRTPVVSEIAKPLQYLPLHPRFPHFLSAFKNVARLFVIKVTFLHLNDFVRIVNALPALQMLYCHHVRWRTLGPLPVSTRPNLDELQLFDVDIHCVQRLVSACGPRLRTLTVSMPFFHDAELLHPVNPTTEHTMGIDLSLCSTLDRSYIWLGPEFVSDGKSLDILRAMLDTWQCVAPLRQIALAAVPQSDFTRQCFADLLVTVGRVLEDWLRGSPAPLNADGEGGKQGSERRRIVVYTYDWEVWQTWWWTHLRGCFPTFAKSGELWMSYEPPPNDRLKWQDIDTPPPIIPTHVPPTTITI
ncbi:hypothetical protein BD311DRAFT_770302 [Dichomitus squalens]|uniref:F-box domain-containing protein n=1 Tax=Dichomitus squalens TaxID=114155 RepID=A0A4Q9M691_9APHY|nr:hypothetical protein BD311DRAFT_770302 [Dichomitus squalens]